MSKQHLIIGAVLAVTVCLSGFLILRSNRPSFQGRSLSSWAMSIHATNPVEHANAERAVRAIGTDALPTLLTWFSHRDSAPKKRVISWLMNAGLIKSGDFPEERNRGKAMYVFRVLGPLARPALPQIRQFTTDPDPTLALQAARVLAWIAPAEASELAEKWATSTEPRKQIGADKVKYEVLSSSQENSHEPSR